MARIMIIARDSQAGEPIAEALRDQLQEEGHEAHLRSAIRTQQEAEAFFKNDVPKYDAVIVGNLEQMIKYQSFKHPNLDLDPMDFIMGIKKHLPKGRVICWEHFDKLPEPDSWKRRLNATGIELADTPKLFSKEAFAANAMAI